MDGTKSRRINAWADKKDGSPERRSNALLRRGRANTANTRMKRTQKKGNSGGGGDIPF